MVRSRLLQDDALLLATSAIWGFAFVAQRVGMADVGPFTFNGVRFALGSLSLVPLILVRRRAGTERGEIRGGRLLASGVGAGGVLFVAASLQQIGIVTTTAGKAGFITGLYVVLVPLAGLLWGQRAGWGRWAGALLAAAGLYLLGVTGRFTVARGDLLVLASALFWAAHVQLVGALAPRTDSLMLAAVQFAACAALSLTAAAFTEEVKLAAVLRAWAPILYGGLGSVGVAYTLQIVVQKTADPAHAAILLSLEGLFAAIGGWIILGERLPVRGVVGCGLMLAGMFASQALAPRRGARDRSDRGALDSAADREET
jgi:drug/metabolite transporter (DMT)-like permease